MASGMLFLRLKAAERALQDGNLDEAFRLAGAPDLRVHRRGAAVLASLAERFLERARTHFRADRFRDALFDLERAEAGGVLADEISLLRRQVQTVAAEQQRQEHSRRGRLKAAQEYIADGSLDAGRRLLERASPKDHDAFQLHREIDRRATEAANHVQIAEKLMAQARWADAAQRIRRARTLDAHHEAIIGIESRLVDEVCRSVRRAVAEGRLGRAASELNFLGDLGESAPAKRELSGVLAIASQAAHHLNAAAYAEARRQLMTIERILPDAPWLSAAVKQLSHLAELRAELLAGPLADLADSGLLEAGGKSPPAASEETIALPDRRDAHLVPTPLPYAAGPAVHRPAPARMNTRDPSMLPDRMLLLVDGGGSFLILRGDQVSIGRCAASDPADLPLFGDLAERHANLVRVDEDYFIFSTREIEVAGSKTMHQLLYDGDRIVLGRRAKLTFRLPSRKTLTAVLDLSDTSKMPNGVRRALLFHQHATIGSGPSAHIFCRHVETGIVLFERNGQFWLRPIDGAGGSQAARTLRLAEPVEMCGANLVLQPWQTERAGG